MLITTPGLKTISDLKKRNQKEKVDRVGETDNPYVSTENHRTLDVNFLTTVT